VYIMATTHFYLLVISFCSEMIGHELFKVTISDYFKNAI